MKLQAPVQVEIKVHITDGESSGVATLTVGAGLYPSEEAIRNAVANFERDNMPDGFRVMSKREFWDELVPPTVEYDEDTGESYTERFAIPGGPEWDA